MKVKIYNKNFITAFFVTLVFSIMGIVGGIQSKNIMPYLVAVFMFLLSLFFLLKIFQTITFDKNKFIIAPIIGRKIYIDYDDISYLAIVENINKYGATTLKRLALVGKYQEDSIWIEQAIRGQIYPRFFFSVNYSMKLEKILDTYFKNKKRIKINNQTKEFMIIDDASNPRENQLINEDIKNNYISIVDAAYDMKHYRLSEWISILFIILFMVLLCIYKLRLIKEYGYVTMPTITAGIYHTCFTLKFPSSNISHVYKSKEKNILYFSLIRYKDPTYGDLHWVDIIDFDKTKRIEICELSKKEAKKLVKGPKKSRKYLKITLKNGRMNGISVANYSLKQIEKIMKEINLLLKKESSIEKQF